MLSLLTIFLLGIRNVPKVWYFFFSFYFRISSAVLSLLPDVLCDEGSDMYNKLIGEPHPPYLVIGGYLQTLALVEGSEARTNNIRAYL
jgi:hypothetical protein